MIVQKISNYNASRYATDKFDNSDIKNYDTDFNTLFLALQGRVRFGGGTSGHNGENISGQFLQITTNGSANTESTFTHTLGSVPVGYIVLWQSIAGSIYQGPSTGTVWTSSTISLKGSAISITALLFLLQ